MFAESKIISRMQYSNKNLFINYAVSGLKALGFSSLREMYLDSTAFYIIYYVKNRSNFRNNCPIAGTTF